jgi:thiamine biosynthesis lipoprotein ApbE
LAKGDVSSHDFESASRSSLRARSGIAALYAGASRDGDEFHPLYIYAADAGAVDREADRAFAVVDQLESLLSNYQPQSELSRINSEAGRHAVTTDPETFRFLKESLAWSARSDGAFDITVVN